MGAKNKVIAGDYLGAFVTSTSGSVGITSTTAYQPVTKAMVAEHDLSYGETSKGIHIVSLTFRNGRKSLLEVDDRIYRDLLTSLF
ncbi:hypothetical protein [Anaerotalea alkaliphila]|uniref:Uncharacterized protein n=1 Tax=Anaerotalea alkaliphila TaxID=2662126 RepID=A0A7X5KMY3_9FIRM|nr:hypothetical protein [Anaerotalea alkaliphila]NDL67454.1 hypothetical protein [Anaerotalea alkaliphila]